MKNALWLILLAGGLAAADDTGWTTYGGNLASWRYSELTQINTANVARLAPAWMFQTRVPGNMETSPLVANGVMYITAPSNHAFALDLRTGRPIWHYSRTPPKPLDLCCGEVNRGFGMLGNRLFKVNIEDTLVALDMASGKPLWETLLGDYRKGYSGTVAPLVIKNKVLVGTGGAEFGTRGFVDAYSAESGERLWRFYTVPEADAPEAASWGKGLRVGGSTWITGTYDPDLNLTYWGTGNPGPDMNGDVRPGDNLYTCSLVALDPDTGKMKWHFQFTPHDTHDWDAVADPVLVDLTIGGRKVKALIQANRNGHFYALDRTNGKFLFARPYTTINWTSGIGADGRPVVVPGLEPSQQGTRACPGLGGGHNWQATAYSPLTGLYYFNSTDGCQTFHRNDKEFVEGEWYQLSGTKDIPTERSKGSFIAIDPATGDIRWRFQMVRNPSGGALATAGGLVFIGDSFGNLIGFDGRNGRVLWRFQTGASIESPPVSYSFEGRQYIAVGSGGTMMTFALPAEPTTQPTQPAAAAAPVVPARAGNREVIRFDGKSLAGWDGNAAWWSAKDGAYTAKAADRVPTTFLLSERNYSDFRLTLWSKMASSSNHAGVSLWGERNRTAENQWGYKGLLVIFPGLGLWDYNLNKGIPVDPVGKEIASRVTSQNEWIQVEILAQGNRIRAAYNGTQVLDWREPDPGRLKPGPIGLQLHGFGQPQEVIYKDVAIESFPKEDRLITLKP